MARVCSSWAEAAAAATTTIKLDSCSNTESLQQWLRSNMVGLQAVTIQTSVGVISSLPWPGLPRLQDLQLAFSSVDLRPGSQLLHNLCAATTLTRLKFYEVTSQGEADLAALLLALPKLLHLSLRFMHSSDQADSFTHFSDEGMQSVCNLTELRTLCLHSMRDVTAAGLVGLQDLQGLEELVLGDLTCEVSLSTVPAFAQLSALTRLDLSWAGDTAHGEFDPSVLAYMTQLKDLTLWRYTPAHGAAGAAELLRWLAHMTRLEELHLYIAHIDSLTQCPPALFSNVTASSMLKSLTWWQLG